MTAGIVDRFRFESKAPHVASARNDASAAHSVKVDLRIATRSEVLGLKADGIDVAVRYRAEAAVPTGALRLFGERLPAVCHRSDAGRQSGGRD